MNKHNNNEVIVSPTNSTVYLKYIHVKENLILEGAFSIFRVIAIFLLWCSRRTTFT